MSGISDLYKMGRQMMSMASKMKDIEAIQSGDTDKIMKRFINKQEYKAMRKMQKLINNK